MQLLRERNIFANRVRTLTAWAMLTLLSCGAQAAAGKPDGLFERLIKAEVPTNSALQVQVDLPGLNAVDATDPRLKVGAAVPAGQQVRFDKVSARSRSTGPQTAGFGVVRVNDAGGFVWSGVVESPGATALRLHIQGMYLPRHVELYLYNDFGEVFGPYTGRGPRRDGDFWTNTLLGDSVYLQLRYEGVDNVRVLNAAKFTVADVGHLDERYPFRGTRSGPIQAEPAAASSNLCPDNAACIENASCTSISEPLKSVQDAVAAMIFASGAWLYLCSGGLIADTDTGSDIPYFLTAHHCIGKSSEAASLETYFHFITTCNNPQCGYADESGIARTLGATIAATGRSGDYSLLQLDQPAPEGTKALPFSRQSVASANNTPLARISHPSGMPQALSRQVVDTSSSTCRSLPRGQFIYSSDTFGATEGGSSGSPVVNANGEIVGQLYGACGYNLNDVCDSGSNWTVDGALASYWPNVAAFLDPATSCTDVDGDGYCATNDCNDSLARSKTVSMGSMMTVTARLTAPIPSARRAAAISARLGTPAPMPVNVAQANARASRVL